MDAQGYSKRQVQKYWDEQPCDTPAGKPFLEGSFEFFENIEENRYRDQAFIHSFVQFTRWHGKRVLEVGCGCGTDLLQFARAGAEICGIDLSQHSLELTRKRLSLYGLQAEVAQGDCENLSFPPEQFDLVYAWGSLHHTPNPDQAVKEIYRVLKPGGCIKAMVYHRFSAPIIKEYLKHGFLKGKPFTSLSEILSKHVESPGTKAYTLKQVHNLFSPFSDVKIQPTLIVEDAWLKGRIPAISWGIRFYPNKLGNWIVVEGSKPSLEKNGVDENHLP